MRGHITVLGGLAAVVRAAPASNTTSSTPTTAYTAASYTSATAPCAVISNSLSSLLSQNPKATQLAVQPAPAIACLKSVPIDQQRDIALIDYLLPYVQQQSTLGFLKNPPEQYLFPGADILGGLAEIRAKLNNGSYDSQYTFTTELRNTFSMAHDGHFGYSPALLGVFTLVFPIEIVSVSLDGITLPKIYALSDLNKQDITAPASGNSSRVSDIISIGGTRVFEFLQTVAALQNSQDPDAAYNRIFQSIPAIVANSGNAFTAPGFTTVPDQLEIVFSNGTKLMLEPRALTQFGFQGVDTGEKLHDTIEVPKSSTSSSVPTPTTSSSFTPNPTVQGYPTPIVKHSDDYIAGYFLENSTYADTAVLVVYSFEHDARITNDTADVLEFKSVAEEFLAKSKAANKTKLVIDLQSNGGGSVISGYELFKLLFPHVVPVNWARIRATELINLVGQAIGSSVVGSVLDSNGQNFKDWPAIYGPDVFNMDNFTRPFQYNFSDPKALDYQLSGYGATPQIAEPPFAASNIVIVTDGVCASTCTIFTGLAARHAGVRTIAYGGRPLAQPMQAMGGVKGAQVLPFAGVQQASVQFLNATNGSLSAAELAILPSVKDAPLLPLFSSSSTGSLNFKNSYRNSTDGTPFQFVYESANCKQFYTQATLLNITRLWQSAADIAWRGAKCVAGSTVNSDGTIGNSTLPFTNAVRSNGTQLAGPGSLSGSGNGSGASSSTTAPVPTVTQASFGTSRAVPASMVVCLTIVAFLNFVM